MDKRYYVKWTDKDIPGLASEFGIAILYTEVDSKGRVVREIGFDGQGNVVHKCPSHRHKHGKYGLFDLVPVDLGSIREEIDARHFEECWNRSELSSEE